MRRSVGSIAALSAVALAFGAGCGSARRSEPLAGAVALSPVEARGQRVFMRECHQCHPGGEAGLGPALNDKPLPGFMMRLQVRAGVGAMPAFSRQEIDDGELRDLVAYVKALRRHGAARRDRAEVQTAGPRPS